MFSIKTAIILFALIGSIYSANTPTPHYQSQCCPSNGAACYSQPSYCSNSISCRKNLASYYCNEAGGYCHRHSGTQNVAVDRWYQCGYKRCYGEFKCVTLVFSSSNTQSLNEMETQTPLSIPSSIEKGR
ncbi:uncharacterized protein MELLADRAFT_124301 [Melampsora larici-populina 98AG31]|uniref:Secreted protein n=1 Tax=Melampsora larici-populina (strain 98AG31 / pathotype 3-4-7) TaxID=747676 RepID=F4R8A7_MELLP|nr:uncharacterized protein MELLADRAFT_124301 [Melampsora larici-populina 98AG31]EGG11643.1 secreted protein [Melampsora larici-populina 98AG31]